MQNSSGVPSFILTSLPGSAIALGNDFPDRLPSNQVFACSARVCGFTCGALEKHWGYYFFISVSRAHQMATVDPWRHRPGQLFPDFHLSL